MIDILVAYAAGTSEMLDVCLSSLGRHRAGADCQVMVITDGIGWEEAVNVARNHGGVIPIAYDIGSFGSGSEMHGKLLDAAISQSKSEYILTLDSDCFPVADGWLGDLLWRLHGNVMLSGILWPWIPAPKSVGEGTFEARIRKNHCWDNTQTACQLVKRSFVVDNKLSFVSGDDTGFNICRKVHEIGGKVDGFMSSCCPLLDNKNEDVEMNRYACVVYGDKIYHQGGSTRRLQGASIDPLGLYDKARDRVFKEKGAEWILEAGNHHRYKLDREEDVAQYKMKWMFEEMRKYLLQNDALFTCDNNSIMRP